MPWGQINLKSQSFAKDFDPIDAKCNCSTCKRFSRSHLHTLISRKETVGCNLITLHNVAYQVGVHTHTYTNTVPLVAQTYTVRTFWVGCPARTLQSVIVKGYRLMPGDVILVGKFVQMVVTSYRLQHPVWTTDPKSTVYDCLVHINYINININSLLYW